MKFIEGAIAQPVTVLVGMMVRRWGFDEGTATSFVIVAAAFLALFLVGWRVAFGLIERRSTRASAGTV